MLTKLQPCGFHRIIISKTWMASCQWALQIPQSRDHLVRTWSVGLSPFFNAHALIWWHCQLLLDFSFSHQALSAFSVFTHNLQVRVPRNCSHLLCFPSSFPVYISWLQGQPRCPWLPIHILSQIPSVPIRALSTVCPPSDALKTHGSRHFNKCIILPGSLPLGISDTENSSLPPNCPAISSRGVYSTLLP